MRRLIRQLASGAIAWSCIGQPASAQKGEPWSGGIFYLFYTATDTRFMVRGPIVNSVRDIAVDEIFKFDTLPSIMAESRPESPIMLGVHWVGYRVAMYETDVQSLSKTYHSLRMADTADGAVIALGITPANVADYRYHVVVDDSVELVPWSPVPLRQNYGAVRPYGWLGRYYLPGKTVLVEARNRRHYGIREGVLLDWKPLARPRVTQIVAVNPSGAYWNLNSDKGNRYATRFDPSTGLPRSLRFPADSVDNFLITMEPHPTVLYRVAVIHNADTTTLDWSYLSDRLTLENRYFANPGSYAVIIQVRGPWGLDDTVHGIRMNFEVLPRPEKKVPLKAAALAFLALGSVASFFLVRNRRTLRRTERDRQRASMRLKAIRSQLNPHFMVNALTSIQQLVSRNDIAQANRYLGTFAGLTRRILMTGEDERISLQDESALLNDYLEMEQLRFGFRFTIEHDPDLDTANIEIPVMLLQPFVENAVKHGVSDRGAEGFIRVVFARRENDVLLTVTDNGSGFDTAARPPSHAYGLRLARERVELVNKLHRDALAGLDIESDTKGTTVRITLIEWL